MTTQNSVNTPTPLNKANGGIGVTASTTLVQVVSATISPTSTSTVFTFTSTDALNTYGVQLLTLDITPLFSTSILDIFASINANCVSSTSSIALVLYRDSGNGIAGSVGNDASGNNDGTVITLRHRVSSGSTSTSTFKLRYGPNTANLITVNGYNGGGIFNNNAVTQFVIKEYIS